MRVRFTPEAINSARQEAPRLFADELAANGAKSSMSRKGDCWDNAVAESFFSTLKAELTERTDYATREQARRSIGEYIDGFYNVERRHSFNGYLNPTEYELRCHVKRVAP